MDFGRCKQCREYLFLIDSEKCKACIQNDEQANWCVINRGPVKSSTLYIDKISREKAIEVSKGNEYLIAVRRENWTYLNGSP